MSASPPVLSPASFPANAPVTPRCSACTKAAPLQCSRWLQGAWNYCSETYRGFVWIVPLLKSASNFLFRYTLKCMHITCLLWTKANKTWTLAQARAKPNLAHSLLHPATIQYSGLSPLHCLFLGGFFFFFLALNTLSQMRQMAPEVQQYPYSWLHSWLITLRLSRL